MQPIDGPAKAIVQYSKSKRPAEAILKPSHNQRYAVGILQPSNGERPAEAILKPSKNERSEEVILQSSKSKKPVEAILQSSNNRRSAEAILQPSNSKRSAEVILQPSKRPRLSSYQSDCIIGTKWRLQGSGMSKDLFEYGKVMPHAFVSHRPDEQKGADRNKFASSRPTECVSPIIRGDSLAMSNKDVIKDNSRRKNGKRIIRKRADVLQKHKENNQNSVNLPTSNPGQFISECVPYVSFKDRHQSIATEDALADFVEPQAKSVAAEVTAETGKRGKSVSLLASSPKQVCATERATLINNTRVRSKSMRYICRSCKESFTSISFLKKHVCCTAKDSLQKNNINQVSVRNSVVRYDETQISGARNQITHNQDRDKESKPPKNSILVVYSNTVPLTLRLTEQKAMKNIDLHQSSGTNTDPDIFEEAVMSKREPSVSTNSKGKPTSSPATHVFVSTKHQLQPFQCLQCGLRLSSFDLMKRHKRSHKKYYCNASLRKWKEYRCRFRSMSSLSDKSSRGGKNQWVCKICDLKFLHIKDWKQHDILYHLTRTGVQNMHLHDKVDDRKDLASLTYFDDHMSQSSQRQDSTGLTNAQLATRSESHSCQQCGKSFAHNSGLEVHMRVHSGARPFQCRHCTKLFKASSTASKHVAEVHDRVYCGYQCRFCLAVFISNQRTPCPTQKDSSRVLPFDGLHKFGRTKEDYQSSSKMA